MSNRVCRKSGQCLMEKGSCTTRMWCATLYRVWQHSILLAALSTASGKRSSTKTIFPNAQPSTTEVKVPERRAVIPFHPQVYEKSSARMSHLPSSYYSSSPNPILLHLKRHFLSRWRSIQASDNGFSGVLNPRKHHMNYNRRIW